MKPIGGYFSLEVNDGRELHANAIHLNAGRYALEYILKARKYNKVYIPYYICDSVLEPINRLGIEYEFYHINESLEPAMKLSPKDGEAVLYVNYFGLKNRLTSSFCYAYPNTILDYTQAFYCERGNKYDDRRVRCDTFYSCRKYFGVPDGAYLYTDCLLNEDLSQGESYERMSFLTKRIDRSAQEGYVDFQANDQFISTMGMKTMSQLTKTIMQGIDYSDKANRRIQNFHILDKVLRNTNFFKWSMDYGTIPLVYPYYVEDGACLRQYLIEHQVVCARYWPNVLEWCGKTSFEYKLAENLVALPIDQRYSENDMQMILDIIQTYGCDL